VKEKGKMMDKKETRREKAAGKKEGSGLRESKR